MPMSTGVSGELVAQLRARALRLTRRREEAEDLLQDVLVIAWEEGRGEPAWLNAVMTRQAAFAVRGARRRRQRDTRFGADLHGSQALSRCPGQSIDDNAPSSAALASLLACLPPSARRIVVLVLHGLSAADIQWLLQLRAAAFRQRLTVVRRGVATLPDSVREALRPLSLRIDPARDIVLERGMLRRALLASARRMDGLGTHDADGHLLLLRR
jgi:RNA polymerase sigma-70 factor (ECF subfamily)